MFTPEQAISIIQTQFDHALILKDRFAGGESGAYLVTDAQGNMYSLKLFDYPEAIHEIPQVKTDLDKLKGRGYPAQQILAIAHQDNYTAALREFIVGDSLEPLTPNFLNQIFQLNQLQANFSETPSDWPKRIIDTLLVGGNGYCLHSSLIEYSNDTRQILDQLKNIAHGSVSPNCSQKDLVHYDFQGGNILVHNDQISGVIDWDGACLGDRFFDLTTLVYYYYLTDSLRMPIESEILAHIPKETLRLYYAHMILRQLDWSIRHHSPKAVEEYLKISQQILKDYSL